MGFFQWARPGAGGALPSRVRLRVRFGAGMEVYLHETMPAGSLKRQPLS